MKIKILLILLLVVLMTGCSAFNTVSNSTTENETSGLIITSTNETNEIDSFELILSEDEETLSELEEVESDESGLLFAISVNEGELVNLNLKAEDPDGDEIKYTYSEPLDENGKWQTKIGDAGTYTATVTASDGVLSTIENIMIIVKQVNHAPTITCENSFAIKEGELLDIPCTFQDVDGDEITTEVHGFIDVLKYQTTYDDAGEYEMTITATDGLQSTQKEIKVTIENTNRLPEITLKTEKLNYVEKEEIQLLAEATDADGDSVTITYSEPLSDDGKWKTEVGDAGDYSVDIIASDGISTTKKTISLKVTQFNLPPVMVIADTLTYKENELITLPLEVTDANGDEVSILVTGFMNDLTYQTTYDDAGEYEIKITVTDGVNSVNKTVKLIIENVNRPPEFILH